MTGGGNIKVVVRCRPLNARETARGAKGLVRMEDGQTILDPPEPVSAPGRAIEKRQQVFSFDKSYWSAGSRDEPGYASQQTLYEDLGVDLLDHSFEGFNTCIFAYGQTGRLYDGMYVATVEELTPDGKDKGLIPLTTSELFRRVEERRGDPNLSYSVEVSYMEIYNEKVRDLLNPKNKGNLRVREHPSLGPYVEDLSKLIVENYSQMMTLMDEGNKSRTVASTSMNETSSRSHAVFAVTLTQKRLDPATKMTGEKVSKISLVDLAGSERQAATGATGTRLKEGANINKSLTTLGKVIAALAQQSEHRGKKRKDDFVPYRDSVLTWLLKESLGGNSKTAMIAAISPADYDETLSTLRYADAAKRIKTHAVVNEDPNAKVIRELKEELEMLRSRVAAGSNGEDVFDPSIPPEQQMVTYRTKDGEIKKVSKQELQDQLEASEKLMEGLNLTWEEKMAATQAIHVAREKALEDLGITVDKDMVSVHAPQKYASLVNLNEDPLMSECLVYQLKPGTTHAGSLDSATAQIKLSGLHIMDHHCDFISAGGEVHVEAMPDARTFVNGKRVPPKTPVRLHHGYRVILGDLHVFRFNDPAGVRAQRTRLSIAHLGISNGDTELPLRSETPAITELMDWTAARREVADIEALGDRDLDKLFDNIVKVRTLRGRPDSRLDMAGDYESRFGLNSTVDDAVEENPWESEQTRQERPCTPPPREEPVAENGVRSLPTTPTTIRSLPTTPSKQVDDPAFERQAVKHLRILSQEMKRIRSQTADARARGHESVDQTPWSPRELVLVRNAVDKWKTLCNFRMAEQLLLHAAEVREANVIAKLIGKCVSYNFVIVDGPVESPKSALDDLGGIVEYEDVADQSPSSGGPRVMVKVIDLDSTRELIRGQSTAQPAVYTWNLSRFQQQLSRMRQVLQVKDKPNYSVHLSVHSPFGDNPSPSFSFIGAAHIPLRLLALQMSYAVTVPIYCVYTMEAIGSCRVEFKCSPTVPPAALDGAPLDGAPIVPAKPFGAKFSFTFMVDSVKGLTKADFTEVHAQTRLSSLVGPGIASEDTFASLPVDLDKSSVSHLFLRRSLSVLATDEMKTHLSTGYATIEFFARARRSYLERLERFDRVMEVSMPTPSPATPPNGQGRPPLRRSDTEFTGVEHHDILALVEIQEMGGEGDYLPAEVEDDIVYLHQGVQRRLHVALSHASGLAFNWTKVAASVDDIRLVSKGKSTSVPAAEVSMQLLADVVFSSDGTSSLVARGTWDTAAHHCDHLDRRTQGDDLVIVRFKLMVDVDSVDGPVVLPLDLRVRVIGRDARRSSRISFWRARPLTNVSAIFGIHLQPPLARTARDLWRLDTAKKPVRNQTILGDWRPRSIALVAEYARFVRVKRLVADVQTTRAALGCAGDVGEAVETDIDEKAVLGQVIDLWKRELETRVMFDTTQETPEEKEMSIRLRHLVPEIAPRLVPSVKVMLPNESVIKRGTLALLKDSRQNVWEELQAVLRPPYIHLSHEAGRRDTQIINVAHANVEPSPDVEMLLGRRHAFKVYTATNSYIIQAASLRELNEWITVIRQG